MYRLLCAAFLTPIISHVLFAEAGTRAKTMRNETQRTPKSAPSSPAPAPRPSYSPPSSPPPSYSAPNPPRSEPKYADEKVSTDGKPLSAEKQKSETKPCSQCSSEAEVVYDKQQKFEITAQEKGLLTNNISINSRLAFTSWDFNFSPAIQYQSTFFPTYELDLNAFGLEFSYMTTLPPQPGDLFREIPILGQENAARQSVMEYLRLAALPLNFMDHPLLKNLIAVEYRKTTKATVITANQNLYYFPYATYPGLTAQDSDLGTIYYEQKAAGSKLAYSIKERDWLFTVGAFAFRIGYFDVGYAKPYQMDADIYQGDILIDRRVFLFEGQADGRGLMIGIQNLYFPNWDTRRFYFTTPDLLADGFFWGLKELGFYWGTGSIRLQNNIDLVEKYREFYQGETGRDPSVSFLRQVFHAVVGYKINRHFKVFVEYRYANYSLALRDSYEDESYNYFLNHAINRDTIQQIAVNLTVAF